MNDYTVRFDRGTRAWTCSVFHVGTDGRTVGAAVATGSGTTRDDARDVALGLASDPAIRAALASADHRRPYWIQGARGEQVEAQRKAASDRAAATRRPVRPARP